MSKCQVCNCSFTMFGGSTEPFTGRNLLICNKCGEMLKQLENTKNIDSKMCKSIGAQLISTCNDNTVAKILFEYVEGVICDSEQHEEEIFESNVKSHKQDEIHKKFYQYKKNFKSTTGYNFEGYDIIEYKGIVSGEVVLGTGFLSEFSASFSDLLGTKSNAFADKMSNAKQAAFDNLIKNALVLGGNALIGVDFDYITFNNNILGVSVNGTSVVIKKSKNDIK